MNYGTQGSSASQTRERRVSSRLPIRFKVWCEGEDFTLLTESINVSSHGIFVRAGSPPPSGTCFRATIEEIGIVAHVEVRWARSYRDLGRAGMGLRVIAFEQGQRALADHIERARLDRDHWLPFLESAGVAP